MSITRPLVVTPWADSGDKVQPTNGELAVGWPSTTIPPSRQRFNWAFNYFANAVRYFSRRGLSDWDADETYEIGDRCIGDDGKTYASKVASNTNFAPSSSPTKWERWGFTQSELDTLGGGLPYGAPASCPDTGPAVGADTKAIYKSSIGEYWMYLGDAWRVVAGRYVVTATYASISASAVIGTHTAKRATTLNVNLTATVVETTGAQSGAREMTLVILKNGVMVKSPHRHIVDYGYSNDIYNGIHIPVTVAAGDVISLQVDKTSPYNVTSIESTILYGE